MSSVPIGLHKSEWDRIRKWTNRDEEDPEQIRKREYIKKMNEISKEMAKEWPNSLENVNKRNEQLRRERLEAVENANHIFYKKYLKKMKEQQEQMMYSAKDIIFKNQDAPKMFLGAVLETAVQKERHLQLNFKAKLDQIAAEQKKKNDDMIIQNSKDWHELAATKKRRRFEVNKQHQRDLLEQSETAMKRRQKEYEDELNLQIIDNIVGAEQMAAIEKFEKERKAAEKKRIRDDMAQSKRESDQRKHECKVQDEMDDKLIEVLNKTRARINARRKKTEDDEKAEKNRILENISNRLQSGDKARDDKEQAILDKAIKEKIMLEDAAIEAKRQKEERFRQERINLRKQFLEDEKQRLHKENTMKQWAMINRFKNLELYQDYEDEMNRIKRAKIEEFRADMLRQQKEVADRNKAESDALRSFYGEETTKKFRMEDNKVLTHAAALIEEAKKMGRPTFALDRAITKYCKMYSLYKEKPLPTSLQKHFPTYAPVDKSKPDSWYKWPEPPVVTKESEDNIFDDKRNGLEEKQEAAKKEQKGNDDYKRQGKANGLQVKKEQQQDLTLPPISAKAKPNEACRCDK